MADLDNWDYMFLFFSMRRKQGALVPLEIAVLETILAHMAHGEEEMHGFAIARELEKGKARTLISHGALYKATGRLHDQGLLEARWEAADIAEVVGRPRRRYYRLTAAGQRALYEARLTDGAVGRLAWKRQRLVNDHLGIQVALFVLNVMLRVWGALGLADRHPLCVGMDWWLHLHHRAGRPPQPTIGAPITSPRANRRRPR